MPYRPEVNPSRKDFQAAADIIKGLPVDEVTRHTIASEFAILYKSQNPRFDRERFFRACGVDVDAHVAHIKRTQFRGNPHHRVARQRYPGATYHVEVWEERDRCHVALWRSWKGQDEIVTDWWDEDVSQMIEDGFFKQGRGLKASVIEYAKDMGIISD